MRGNPKIVTVGDRDARRETPTRWWGAAEREGTCARRAAEEAGDRPLAEALGRGGASAGLGRASQAPVTPSGCPSTAPRTEGCCQDWDLLGRARRSTHSHPRFSPRLRGSSADDGDCCGVPRIPTEVRQSAPKAAEGVSAARAFGPCAVRSPRRADPSGRAVGPRPPRHRSLGLHRTGAPSEPATGLRPEDGSGNSSERRASGSRPQQTRPHEPSRRECSSGLPWGTAPHPVWKRLRFRAPPPAGRRATCAEVGGATPVERPIRPRSRRSP
jgi:hypothetical protein